MQEKHILVSKTARYYMLGDPSEKVTHVWFVCHGYGQVAGKFLKNFQVLDTRENLVVAPEGLHRFYWNGFDGKVVASWMTREDRLNDIKDYVSYLDSLYDKILGDLAGKKTKITILGFSQGVATVCRWLCLGKAKADHLVLWAGVFPPDLKFDPDQNVFKKLKTTVVVGNQDEFLKEGQIEEYEKILKNLGIDYRLIRFEGKHEINEEVLKKISKMNS